MKNLFKKTMLFAAAAMAFVSCNDDKTNDVITNSGVEVAISATTPVKSVFGQPADGKYPTSWEGTEAWYAAINEKDNKIENAEISFLDDNTTAHARHTFTNLATEGVEEFTLYAISPAEAKKGFSAGKFYSFEIGGQEPTATSCDPKAQVLVAKSETKSSPESFNIVFKHATAYANFSFVNLDAEGVTGVTVESEVPFAGKWQYMFEDGSLVADGASSVITLATNSTENLWLACAPVDLRGKKLTFCVNTSNGSYTKVVNLPENSDKYVFKSGVIAQFNVDMAGIAIEAPERWTLVTDASTLAAGDKIIIAAKDSDVALSTTQNGNNRGQATITKEGDYLVDPASNVQIITLEAGSTAGTLAFYVEGEKTGYLYAAGGTGSNNYLRTGDKAANGSWNISIADNGAATIKCADTTVARHTIRYNSTSSCFSCYASGQKDVVIYKLSGGNGGNEGGETPSTPAPELTITTTSPIEVAAEGGTAEIGYTITDPIADQSVTASVAEDVTWIKNFDCATANKITFTVDANDGALREATVTIAYDGAVSKTVTVKQAAAQQGGDDVVGEGVTDILNRALTGVTGTNYADWSGKKSNSSAVYAGQSAGGNESIQLRSNNNNSGIVTTASAGKVTKIVVTWHSETNSARKLQIYGKNSAYSAATDLYSSTTSGTLLGELNCGASTFTVSGDYAYIGLRSADGAIYLSEVKIDWNGGSNGGSVATPVLSVTAPAQVSADGGTAEISYDITDPIAGQSVTASVANDVTWIKNFNYATANKITFTVEANDGEAREADVTISYDGAESKIVKVSQAAGKVVEPEQPGGGDEPATKVWTLVTDASTLKAGDQIIIASNAKSKTASATITSQYMTEVSSTFSSDKKTITSVGSGTAILTLGGSAGAWTLTNESGKKLGATAVKKVAWDSGTTTWTISISSNNATIQSTTSSYGRFLHNVSATRFIPYTSNTSSSMLLPQIYRLQ